MRRQPKSQKQAKKRDFTVDWVHLKLNDPLFETVGQGPRPPEEELDCRGTAYVEDGYMGIAWNGRVPDEPDWDQMEGDSVAVV